MFSLAYLGKGPEGFISNKFPDGIDPAIHMTTFWVPLTSPAPLLTDKETMAGKIEPKKN